MYLYKPSDRSSSEPVDFWYMPSASSQQQQRRHHHSQPSGQYAGHHQVWPMCVYITCYCVISCQYLWKSQRAKNVFLMKEICLQNQRAFNQQWFFWPFLFKVSIKMGIQYGSYLVLHQHGSPTHVAHHQHHPQQHGVGQQDGTPKHQPSAGGKRGRERPANRGNDDPSSGWGTITSEFDIRLLRHIKTSTFIR